MDENYFKKTGQSWDGATRPIAIPKHNNHSFPILYKALIYPFAFYGLDIVSTWWSKAIKLFDIILELKTDCFVVGVTIIYIYIYMLTLAWLSAWLSWERTIGLLWITRRSIFQSFKATAWCSTLLISKITIPMEMSFGARINIIYQNQCIPHGLNPCFEFLYSFDY